LNNVANSTPSTKLAELFSGLSTTITSGSSLQDFFQKRSETLMAAYRLEREDYIKLAEMFMDIYIAVVIAAPMILMIVLILILKFNIVPGLSELELTMLMISIIALINVVFISVIHLKQPNY
jgi:archaellum biogenesis protein FlaJ (TadC family)